MKFYAEIKGNGRIIPLHDSDYDVFKKCKRDTVLQFEVKQKRNYQFHKKFFALIEMVYNNQDVYTSSERLREDLTIESGYYEEHITFDGEIKLTAKSISFAKMDDIEFSQLYSDFCNTIIRVLGWDNEMIEDNLESYL